MLARSICSSIRVKTGSRLCSRQWITTPNFRASLSTQAYKDASPAEAHEMMKDGKRYLDVRTPEEFSAGHPPGAVNVPVLLSGMAPNPRFTAAVSEVFPDKAEAIVVGCKSGRRSLSAIQAMSQAGYLDLINQAGGWDGWAANGLPTEH